MAKPKGTIDDLIKKYGVSGNTKPTATKSDNKPTSTKSDKGKQNKNSASSVDDLIKKYTSGKSTTSTKPTTSGKTPFTTSSKKSTTKKATDYSGAVKYLEDKGYQGASSIMTQSEWRRRNKTGTYQDYLDSMISKYESGKASTDAYMPRFEKHDADYWKKRYEEEVERIKSEHPNDFAFPVGAHATAIVEEEMKREEYLLKYQDKTYKDNFWGQFAASYRAGDISERSNKAVSDYLSSGNKSDYEYSEQLDTLAGRLQKNNENVFADDATLPWVSQDFAGYLPQFINRTAPQATGGAVGAIGGAFIGGLATAEGGGFGALPGAKYGAKIGATLASGYDSYDSMRASAFKGLVELGADEETARAAANDEALLGAITEMGDTWFSLTKFGYGAALNLIGKGAAKETAKSGLKKVAVLLGKYGLNIEQERAEEGIQGAISVANRRRVQNGEDTSLLELAKDAGKVLVGVDFGTEDEETINEIKEQKRAGGVIGAIMGLPGTAFDVGATTYIETQNAKTRRVVDAVISSALETNEESEAHKKAEAVKAKIDAGENISKEELVEVAVATEKEQSTAEPDTLEKAARDVVAERNRTPIYERLEAQSQNNEPISVADVKKVTGFGDNGSEVVAKTANVDGATFYQTVAEVKPSYLAGFNNPDMDIKKVAHTFTSQAQEDAYTAGQQDAIMQNAVAKENAKSATVYDGIFTENEYTKNWSKATKKMVSTVAKHFGMDISAVDRIIASVTIENGVETEHEANASHYDGKMEISNNKTAEKLIHALVMHESGHRMEQFATDEWNELCSFLYERAERLGRRVELGISQGMLFDDVKAEHDNAGISLSTKGYIGEIAVRELETIFSSPEEFNSFVSEIESNQQVKSAWGKFVQWLSELIEDLKRAWSQRKMTAEEKASIKELERIKELYAKAYLATRDAVAERAKEQSAKTNSTKNLEIKINEEYNGNANYSLYSYPKLNKSEWALLNDRLKIEIQNSNNFIDDYTKWLYATRNNTRVFAIYGIGWGNDATPLYAVGGKKAEQTYNKMLNFMEGENEEFNGSREDFESWLNSYSSNKGETGNNISDDGNRGTSIRNGSVYSEQQTSNGKRTDGRSTKNSDKVNYSLKAKDQEYLELAKDPKKNEKQLKELVDEAAKKSGYLGTYYHGSKSDFTVFKKEFGGASNSNAGIGFWFTETEEGAKNWVDNAWWGDNEKGKVYKTYLRLNNPKVYETVDTKAQRDELYKGYESIDKEMTLYDDIYYFDDGRRYHTERYDYDKSKRRHSGIYAWDAFKAIVKKYDSDTIDYYLSKVDESEREIVKQDAERYLELNKERKALENQITELRYSDAYELFRSDMYKQIGLGAEDANIGGTGKYVENKDEMLKKYVDMLRQEGYDGIVIKNTSFDSEFFGDHNNQYLVFDSNQVKSAEPVTYDDKDNIIPLSERFNTKNDDIRYSLKDSEYQKAVENGDTETASKLIEETAEKAFSNSKVRDENGKLKLVYHGRVSDFTVFDRKFANIEGDFGKGYYFTSNEYDVDENYANEEGPDLKNKISRLAERLEWEDEYADLSYDEREEIARQRLVTSEPSTITAYLNIKNPVYITPDEKGTFLDFTESYDEEYDEYGEPEGLLVDFIEALNNNAREYSTFGDVDFNFLYEHAYDGGMFASDVVKVIKNNIVDEISDDNGDVAINEVIRLAFEEIGFDGIIDTSVYYKFRNMNGMDSGTTHYIVFNSNQIKSADIATYDNEGKLIPLSERFNVASDDIRFSLKDIKEKFVENKGRNTDFTISDTMYRLPSDKSFSLKGTNNINTKDRKDLLDIIEHLKGEFELTKFAKADPKKLAKMTRSLLKEYSSQADFDETFKAIDALYGYMANGEEGNVAWDEVYSRAYNIARTIAENAVVVDDSMYQSYKHLRDYLRTTPMKFTEYDSVPTSYENFNDFRKQNMGRLKFTKDGMSIDSVYQELANIYPEFFSEDEYSSADQLERMIDVLDELQPMEINPFDRQIEQVSMQIANDLTSRFFDIPQAKPTFADKAERRVVEAHIKGGKKVEAVRQQKDAKIQKLIEAQREKTKKQLDKLREQRDKKVEKEKAKRRDAFAKMSESKKAKELRARIIRHTGELNKTLLKATDKKHIPPELENAVVALLYNINLESNYSYDVESNSYKKNDEGLPTNKTKAFRELKEVYETIAKNNDYGLTIASELFDATGEGVSNIFDDVMKLSDKKIADMTSQELTLIYDTIRLVEHSITTANKMFAMQKWEGLTETAKAFEKSVATRRARNPLRTNYTIDIETPITFFSHFGEAGQELFEALRVAQDNGQMMIDEITEIIEGIVSLEDVQKANKEIHEFTTTGGKKLTLSKAHIMDIYLLYNRNQGRKHLLYDPDSEYFGKGIRQPEIKSKKIGRGTENIRLTKTDIGNIISKLSEQDKAIAGKMQKATLKLAEWGNKACMEVFGYEKFNDPDYWTIKSAPEGTNKSVEKNKNTERSIKNMGSAKQTDAKATNALEIGGIFDVFNQHASDMICYSSWLAVVEDAMKLYNFTLRDEFGNKTDVTFQDLLNKYAGKGGSDYYFNLLSDIQNGIGTKPDTKIERIYTSLYGKAAKAKVMFKATVVAQQPMSIVRALNVLNPTSIMKALGKGGVNLPAWAVGKAKNLVTKDAKSSDWYGGWQRALKYAPIAARKAVGGYEINSNSSGLESVLYKPKTVKGKTVDALKESPLWAAGKADEIAWGVLWNACEFETSKNKSLEKGSEAFYKATAELFNKVINETQVVDGVLQRSQIMRSSSGWIKPATAFKGEPIMALNTLIRAYDNLRYETNPAKRGKAIKSFSRATSVFVASAIFTAFARSLAVGLVGDDDEEYWKKVWKSFSGVQGDEETWFDFVKNVGLKSDVVNNVNPLSWLPITSEMISALQGYDVERLDVASIGEFVNASTTFINSLDEEGKNTIPYATRNLLLKFAELTGYSPYNLVRDIEGAIKTVRTETNDVKGLYDMEKWRTRPASNTSKYIDILYKAYSTDHEAYEDIYNDMVDNGVDAKKIQSGMETRMKKAEGVKEATDLSKRYMTPDDEKQYDSSLSKVKSSQVWKSANAEQRKKAKSDLYNFLTSDTEDMENTRAEARRHGVDETEYTLWKLAIEMADQPKGTKGSGSYDYKEKAEAINSLNLDDREIAYFFGKGLTESGKEELNEVLNEGIDVQDYVNFKAAVSDMKADKNAKGKSIPNSKKKKVVRYLNSAGLTEEEWYYFYYEIMNYKK